MSDPACGGRRPTLGRKEGNKEERDNPNPLKRIRDFPGPVTLQSQRSSKNTSGEERSSTPAHGYPRSEVTSHGNRGDFCGIGGSQGLEDTPGDTTDDVSGQEHFDILGKEQAKDYRTSASD